MIWPWSKKPDYSGHYDTWDEARKHTKADYRDDICLHWGAFDEADKTIEDRHTKEVCEALIGVPTQGKDFSILDIGGGNGNLYRVLDRRFNICSYDIVEVPLVAAHFKSAQTKYETWFTDIPKGNHWDVAILSGVLQYVEYPWRMINAAAKCADWLIINRLPYGEIPVNRFTIQTNKLVCRVFPRPAFETALVRLVGTIVSYWDAEWGKDSDGKPCRYAGYLVKVR